MTSKPLSKKQKVKYERILKEATRLFSFRGYDDTTVAQIAKASEMSFGSVFTYFETKEKLFEAVISEPLQETRDLFKGLLDRPDMTANFLEGLVERHILYFAKNTIVSTVNSTGPWTTGSIPKLVSNPR